MCHYGTAEVVALAEEDGGPWKVAFAENGTVKFFSKSSGAPFCFMQAFKRRRPLSEQLWGGMVAATRTCDTRLWDCGVSARHQVAGRRSKQGGFTLNVVHKPLAGGNIGQVLNADIAFFS